MTLVNCSVTSHTRSPRPLVNTDVKSCGSDVKTLLRRGMQWLSLQWTVHYIIRLTLYICDVNRWSAGSLSGRGLVRQNAHY